MNKHVVSSLIVSFLMAVGLCACKTPSGAKRVMWPRVDVLPDDPPSDLERSAPTSVVRNGSDGFTYIVGGLPNDVATGTPFLARYSGDWPLQDLPRPALATGRVLKRFDRDVALVSVSYRLPDSEIDGLEVTWEEPEDPNHLGKGISRVERLAPTETSDVALGVGGELGVQRGDIYALVEPVAKIDDALSVQLARRLIGICLVDTVEAESSTCRLWRGSSTVPGKRAVAEGDIAIFLEHTYGRRPREAVIQVANVSGAKNDAVQQMLRDALELYVDSLPLANARVETIDEEFDATSPNFHRVGSEVDYSGHAQMVVGASLVDRGGVQHLVLNYTGVGPAVGPGMVAAPPERGVDLGPVDQLDPDQIRGFSGVVWGGVLVYRGQTSEALMHLHLVLNDRRLKGPFRWHARDQYAMRWAALGFLEHALWLVLEDEAVATKRNDRRAYLNGLGTRVRLYDLLELPARALEASSEYLRYREEEDSDSSAYLAALGMHVEMLLGAEKLGEARLSIEKMRESCPTGCEGDLSIMLSGAFWSTPDEEDELRDALLADIVSLSEKGSREQMASARTYQGLNALREDRLEDALIAFLEAERLYTATNNLAGVSRTKYFMFLTQLSRQEPQEAFELAVDAIERDRELGDFEAAARTYERLASLYTNIDSQTSPGPWLGAARDVLAATVQAQLARGNYSKTSEALFALGAFLLRLGEVNDAQAILQRGVLFAIRATRFDMAAMSHLWLGIVAREQNDAETFKNEIHRAQIMSEISDDPAVKEAIDRALNPPDDDQDTPTQLL